MNYILSKGKTNYGKIVTLGFYSVYLHVQQVVVNERLQLLQENFGIWIGVAYGRWSLNNKWSHVELV